MPHKLNHTLRQRGFTLTELLVVIVIIALLAVMVSIGYIGAKNKISKAAAQASIQSIATAIQQLYIDTKRWPAHRDVANCFVPVSDPAIFLDIEWSYKPFEEFNCELTTGASPNGPYLELTLPWYGLTGLDCGDDGDCSNDSSDPTGNSNEYPGWKGPYLSNVELDPWGDQETGMWGYSFEGDYNDAADGKTKSAIQSNGPDRTTGSALTEEDDIVLITCHDLDTGSCPTAWTWR